MDVPTIVAAFNRLPRTPLVPSGLVPNHWHFSVRHVTLSPPALLLQIVNPGSEYVHCAGPAALELKDAPAGDKATVWAALLLQAFANTPDLFHLRPWSWSTNDESAAQAMGERLRQWGVTNGLG